jgi:hypothetical protein
MVKGWLTGADSGWMDFTVRLVGEPASQAHYIYLLAGCRGSVGQPSSSIALAS